MPAESVEVCCGLQGSATVCWRLECSAEVWSVGIT